ncbi:hypothetical protein MJ565_24465 [Klebsiella pneumoniae]|nr:hypothetical protein MJ565_24465 [Klebsiella pneumoniae]
MISELCFQGVVSRIGGASFDDFQQDLLNSRRKRAPGWRVSLLAHGGLLEICARRSEYHAYNPDVVRTLQQAVQSGEYKGIINNTRN